MIRHQPNRLGLPSALLAGLILIWAPLPFASVPETWRNTLVVSLGLWAAFSVWAVQRLRWSPLLALVWVALVAALQSLRPLAYEGAALLPASMTPALSLRLVPLWLTLGVFAWLLADLCRSRSVRRVVVATLCLSAAAQFVLGSLAILRGDTGQIWRTPIAAAAGQLRGTYVNSNHLAFLLLLVVPLLIGTGRWALHRWRGSATRGPAYLVGGSLALVGALALLAGLLLTGSRTAVLLSVVQVAVHAGFWLRQAVRTRGVLAPAAVALLGLMLVVVALRVADRRSDNSAADRMRRASSLTLTESGRWAVYSVALGKVVERPFWGFGLGSFRDLVETDEARAIEGDWWHAHSDPLELLSGVGLLGTLPLVVGWVLVLLRGVRMRPKRSEDRVLQQSVLLAVAVAPLQSLVDFPLSNPANALALIALVAVADGLWRSSVERAPAATS